MNGSGQGLLHGMCFLQEMNHKGMTVYGYVKIPLHSTDTYTVSVCIYTHIRGVSGSILHAYIEYI